MKVKIGNRTLTRLKQATTLLVQVCADLQPKGVQLEFVAFSKAHEEALLGQAGDVWERLAMKQGPDPETSRHAKQAIFQLGSYDELTRSWTVVKFVSSDPVAVAPKTMMDYCLKQSARYRLLSRR